MIDGRLRKESRIRSERDGYDLPGLKQEIEAPRRRNNAPYLMFSILACG